MALGEGLELAALEVAVEVEAEAPELVALCRQAQ
jgi:hypothetical protein